LISIFHTAPKTLHRMSNLLGFSPIRFTMSSFFPVQFSSCALEVPSPSCFTPRTSYFVYLLHTSHFMRGIPTRGTSKRYRTFGRTQSVPIPTFAGSWTFVHGHSCDPVMSPDVNFRLHPSSWPSLRCLYPPTSTFTTTCSSSS